MSLRQRRLGVATRVPLVPIVVFAGWAFSVGTEVVLDGRLNFHGFEDKTDYCNDEGEISLV
jgi:hypothetical protein